MPIYEYQCKDCNKTLEVMQKFSDPPLEKCTECGAAKPTKLISRSSFHLKGSGWYQTDYKNPQKDTKAEPSVSSTSGSKKESAKAEPKKAATESKKP